MDLLKVLAQLREELENLDAAIFTLERLQHEPGVRRRGRPPKALSDIRRTAPGHPEQPPSPEGG